MGVAWGPHNHTLPSSMLSIIIYTKLFCIVIFSKVKALIAFDVDFITICVRMIEKLQTVCPGEQQTTLMCSTNQLIFLEWSISSLRQTETTSISNLDQNPVVKPILIDSANFIFSRVSSPGVLPLVSTMTIMNITSNLEGAIITCTELNSSSVSSVVLMTVIHVYDMDVGRSQTDA